MKTFIVPCYWEVVGYYVVEAESPEEAVARVSKSPLPPVDLPNDLTYEIPLEEVEEIQQEFV